MTSRKLASLGRRVMRRLEMHEWIPNAEFRVRKLDGLYGESDWHAEERKCWIAINPDTDDVMGETLVHECFHVLLEGHLPPMDRAKYDAGYELGLNRAARAVWKGMNDSN